LGLADDGKRAVNVHIDGDRVFRLGFKILDLLGRKGKENPSRSDILTEYWSVRFVVLYYEAMLGELDFDNEDEVVAGIREWIDRRFSRQVYSAR
jgi:hypothetical protein